MLGRVELSPAALRNAVPATLDFVGRAWELKRCFPVGLGYLTEFSCGLIIMAKADLIVSLVLCLEH